jgi:hypothetical protein
MTFLLNFIKMYKLVPFFVDTKMGRQSDLTGLIFLSLGCFITLNVHNSWVPLSLLPDLQGAEQEA